jgi:hypothetical protein
MSLKVPHVKDLVLSLELVGGGENFKRWGLVGSFGLLGGLMPSNGIVRPSFFFFVLPQHHDAIGFSPPHAPNHDVLPTPTKDFKSIDHGLNPPKP